VPFLLKDLGAMQKGQCDLGFRAPFDTTLGARFRAAGFITLGKTNLPEFGMQTTTQPLAFGATHNPWDLDRSTSGSSGGSCAAVAAGMVPVAHANDGGGSIRLPAAWCSRRAAGSLIVGRARAGRTGGQPHGPRYRGRARCSARLRAWRSLFDSAASPSYAAEVGADPGKLRIGILTRTSFAEIHPECREATVATAKLLESLGHRVEESSPEVLSVEETLLKALNRARGHVWTQALGTVLGRPVTRDDVEPYSSSVVLEAEEPPVVFEEYLKAMGWLNQWARRVARWWSTGFDLLLTPTVWEPPAALVEMAPPADKPWTLLGKIRQQVFFTSPFNLTGQPAISLPLHWTADGLPVGVQLVAAIGREDLLIRVAAQLEQARPWSKRRPPVHA
jgi:amidase